MKEVLNYLVMKTDWMKTFVGVTFVTVTAWCVYKVFTTDIPIRNTEIVHFMAGEVFGITLSIAQFYFGSSKGSQQKQEIIADQAKQATK